MTFGYYATHLTNRKIIMKRVTCIALVILGLVFQPFAYARSASVIGGNAENSIMTTQTTASGDEYTTDGHSMDMGPDKKSSPCHQTSKSDSGMDDCDDCCKKVCAMVTHCTSHSSVALAILPPPYTLPKLDSVLFERRAVPLGAAACTLPIYHPPAHS